jgi:hypothetical protein
MPETLLAWAMFVFFAGGAAGGWLILVLWCMDEWRRWAAK